MPTTLNPAGNPSVPSSIDIPSDGETLDEASITPAFQGLLDGVANLDSRIGSWKVVHIVEVTGASSVVIPTAPAVAQLASTVIPTIPSNSQTLVVGSFGFSPTAAADTTVGAELRRNSGALNTRSATVGDGESMTLTFFDLSPDVVTGDSITLIATRGAGQPTANALSGARLLVIVFSPA